MRYFALPKIPKQRKNKLNAIFYAIYTSVINPAEALIKQFDY